MKSSLHTKILISIGVTIFLVLGSSTFFNINNLRRNYLEAIAWRSEALAQDILQEFHRMHEMSVELDVIFNALSLRCMQIYEFNQQKDVAHVAIVDTANIIRAHNNSSYWNMTVESPVLRQYLQEQHTGTILDTAVYHTFIPIISSSGEDVGVVDIGFPKRAVDEKVYQILANTGGLFVIFIIVAFGAVSLLVNLVITKPVLRLQTSSSAIAEGDLDQRIDISATDELGVLARSFAAMRDAIRDKITALQTLNAELDQRVEERTAELAEAYQEITNLNERLHEENLRMGAELDVSRRIQQMVLPSPEEFHDLPGLEIAGIMQPADEIGGDYYDVLAHNGMVYLGIGDVTGHGLESGVIMLMTQTAIRTLIEHGETDPERFLATVNRTLYKNIQRMQAEKTITLTCLRYADRQVHLSGQHEDLLVARADGRVERVDTVDLGFPLGLTEEIGDWLNSVVITLQPGDGIVLYTDGITEAENPAGEMYGIERLCGAVSRNWAAPADSVQHAVIADVTTFIGTQKVHDDLTVVVLKQQ